MAWKKKQPDCYSTGESYTDWVKGKDPARPALTVRIEDGETGFTIWTNESEAFILDVNGAVIYSCCNTVFGVKKRPMGKRSLDNFYGEFRSALSDFPDNQRDRVMRNLENYYSSCQ